VLSSDKEGFDLLEHVRVKNWLRFYTFFISFYIDSKNYKAIIPNSIATLSGWDGQPIECEVVLYKKQYVRGEKLISEVYLQFLATQPEGSEGGIVL
jgi:hypothetical protein